MGGTHNFTGTGRKWSGNALDHDLDLDLVGVMKRDQFLTNFISHTSVVAKYPQLHQPCKVFPRDSHSSSPRPASRASVLCGAMHKKPSRTPQNTMLVTIIKARIRPVCLLH